MSIRASLIAALALTLVATAGAAPGNGKIAYVRDGSAFVANSDGSGEVGIATDASALPMWSPDGGHLAYLRRIQHSDGSADFVPVVTAADGSNATQLATQGQFALGCWLDASTLVAVSTYSPPPPQTYPLYNDLYTFSLGGTANRLTSDGGAKLVSAQGCAPDGSAIAFAKQQPDSKLKAFVANRDGSSSRLLTPVGFSDSAPAWSPNGDGLAFARYGVESGLYVSDTSGGGLRRVTTTVGEGVRWSPDSERLLFTRRYTDYTHCSRYGCAVQSELRTIDADGAQERVLGEGEADATQGWSPDGTRIVSTSFNGSIVRNADGTCRTLLPPNVSPTLAWQPLPGQPPAPELTCADLELSADVSFVDLPLNAIGVYTLTVVNQGNRAASAVALDQPPAKGITLLDAQPSQGTCTRDASLHCDLGALPSGATAHVSVTVHVDASRGSVSAHASAPEPDGYQSDNVAQVAFTVFNCTMLGTDGPDGFYGTPRRDLICGRYGNDTIYGNAGNDLLDGGEGADLIYGGRGRDVILGKGGNDVILARDGERDWIDCGPEKDTAVVDRFDSVRNCRTVYRPKRHRR